MSHLKFVSSFVATLAFVPSAYANLPCASFHENTPLTLPAELDEISGLALSHANPNYFWAHTDSGGQSAVYLISPERGLVRIYDIQGATNVDWEDIAVGPCHAGDTATCLYISDLGDNLNARQDKKIYLVAEPELPDDLVYDAEAGHATLQVLETIAIAYPESPDDSLPEGARGLNPDCESLMVAPDATMYIVSKQSPESKTTPVASSGYTQALYRVARDGHAEFLASYNFRASAGLGTLFQLYNATTAADFSPDGRSFAVRTYSEVYRYDLQAYPDIAEAFAHPVKTLESPEIQGESVAFLHDGKSLATASEKGPFDGGQAAIRLYTCVDSTDPVDPPVDPVDPPVDPVDPPVDPVDPPVDPVDPPVDPVDPPVDPVDPPVDPVDPPVDPVDPPVDPVDPPVDPVDPPVEEPSSSSCSMRGTPHASVWMWGVVGMFFAAGARRRLCRRV